jgi:hypothetical protein
MPPELREALRAASPQAVATLIEIMRAGNDRDRLVAAQALLDRTWGKPEQSVAVALESAIADTLEGIKAKLPAEVFGLVVAAIAEGDKE